MIKVIFLILLSLALHAEERVEYDQSNASMFLNADVGVSSVIDGCVNAITGDYVQSCVDLTVAGPEPLAFQRYYSSSDRTLELFNGWRHNLNSFIKIITEFNNGRVPFRRFCEGEYHDSSGRVFIFNSITKPAKQNIQMPLSGVEQIKGLTNCAMGVMSARTNSKNLKLNYKRKGEGKFLKLPSGATQYFKNRMLDWELRPNRHKMHFLRDENGEILETQLSNDSDTTTFSSIKIHAEEKDSKKKRSFCIHGSNGQSVNYKLARIKQDSKFKARFKTCYYISDVIASHLPHTHYEYQSKIPIDDVPGFTICKKSLPNGRFQNIQYYEGTEYNKKKYKNHFINRVRFLYAPVGVDHTPIRTYHFKYRANIGTDKNELLDGYTEIYNAYNHKLEMHYDDKHRLTKTKKYKGIENHQLYSEETLLWSDKKHYDTISLTAKYLFDSAGQVQTARIFIYDHDGNVIHEKLYGNLSGYSIPIVWDEKAPLENGTESYNKYYTYTSDDLHLMTSEREDNGCNTLFFYHPNTELIAAKIVRNQEENLIRHFFEYDHNGVAYRKIIDDGKSLDKHDLTGVTRRFITCISSRRVAPFGLPEKVDEYYLDLTTQKQVLIQSIIFIYSKEGYLLQENHFDANGAYRFSLYWEYDAHGNVTKEINAIGNVIEKKYDENNNLIWEKTDKREVFYLYDFSNRLIKKEECYLDKTKLVFSYRYDLLGNRIASTDACGNETLYFYDDFSRLIFTQYPAIISQTGELRPSYASREYNVLNQQTRLVNQCGGLTTYKYNLYGKPVEVVYPDGTCERFKYQLDGSLEESIEKNGTLTRYHNDCFGRLCKKEVFSKEGLLLQAIETTYNSFDIASTTDISGKTVRFHYDDAGKLIRLQGPNSNTFMEYDSLGRLHKSIEQVDDKLFRSIVKEYDLLDRVIEESIFEEDKMLSLKKIKYDSEGNIEEEIHETSKGRSVIRKEFNGGRQVVKTIDPLGHITYIRYNYGYINPINPTQKVAQVIEVDPLGNQITTTYNALGLTESVIRQNLVGVITSKKELFYTLLGDCEAILETIITPDQEENRKLLTTMKRNGMRELTEMIYAVGTPQEKRTQIFYNNFGQKERLVKPDGIDLLYRYDALNRLIAYKSSDQTISYAYTYDTSSLLVNIKDLIANLETFREYDSFDQLVSEKMSNGLLMRYEYDKLGRPTKVILPDDSSVHYTYDALYLKKVKRYYEDKEMYSHTYDEYDLSGNILKTSLVNDIGKVSYGYDLMNRLVESSIQKEEISYDAVGNVKSVKVKDLQPKIYDYDDLYQVTKESGATSRTYLHDSLYNCVKKDGKRREINALNQLIHDGETSFIYDVSGNLVSEHLKDENIIYEYDALDRLTKVIKDKETYVYEYDAFNRRVSTKVYEQDQLVEKSLFLYQGQDEVGYCDVDHKIIQYRVLGKGRGAEIGATVAIELLDKEKKSKRILTPIHDYRGNISQILDDQGKVVEQYAYSAFGEEEVFDGKGDKIIPINPWRFSSKRKDVETGFVYFGRRYYKPEMCVWITQDPAGLEAGPNLYAYVSNNPLNKIDLYGLIEERVEDSIAMRRYDRDFLMMQSGQAPTAPGMCPLRVPGHLLYRMGELIPISVISGTLKNLAGLIAGHGLGWNPYNKQRIHSRNMNSTGDHELASNARLLFVPGILNGPEEFPETINNISGICGGAVVHATYNASHELVFDLLEFVAQFLSIPTNSVAKLVKNIRNNLRELGEDGMLYLIGHSQGGMICYRSLQYLTPDERRRISVYTFGTAKVIDSDELGLARAKNYISYRDPVPFIADPIGVVQGYLKNDGTVEFLESNNYPFIDHMLSTETYQNKLDTLGRSLQKSYGSE